MSFGVCVCVCAVNHPILNFFSSGENWKKNFTYGSCFFFVIDGDNNKQQVG